MLKQVEMKVFTLFKDWNLKETTKNCKAVIDCATKISTGLETDGNPRS